MSQTLIQKVETIIDRNNPSHVAIYQLLKAIITDGGADGVQASKVRVIGTAPVTNDNAITNVQTLFDLTIAYIIAVQNAYSEGSVELEFNGVTTEFQIPHGLSEVPTSINILLSKTTDTITLARTIVADANQIIITFSTPPLADTITCWYQAYK